MTTTERVKQAQAFALYLTACGARPAIAAKDAWTRYFGTLRDVDAAEWLRLIAVCRAAHRTPRQVPLSSAMT